MKNITWVEFIYNLIVNFCEKNSDNVFTLKDFFNENYEIIQKSKPNNNNIKAKVRQQLQILRDDNLLEFVNNKGTYFLKNIDLKKSNILKDNVIKFRTLDITQSINYFNFHNIYFLVKFYINF